MTSTGQSKNQPDHPTSQQSDCHDVLLALSQTKLDLYSESGFVELIDVMPRLVPVGRTCDIAICRNARVSTGNGDKSIEDDRRLINYLYKHRHTSPFEAVQFKFRIKMPLFVERQLIRHRTAKVNSQSGRYGEYADDYFLPKLRMQSRGNKQTSDNSTPPTETSLRVWSQCEVLIKELYKHYNTLLSQGVAREVARCCLPVSQMSQMMWTMDLHNLLHFLNLRQAPDAQPEIQELANAIATLIAPLVPDVFAALAAGKTS